MIFFLFIIKDTRITNFKEFFYIDEMFSRGKIRLYLHLKGHLYVEADITTRITIKYPEKCLFFETVNAFTKTKVTDKY